ncbi:MAG: hypothetical protein ACL7BU_06040 [Candidatus Phlomobacter fragariae]
MKYSLDIKNKNDIPENAIKTEIGERGFAISTGYIQVYHYNYDSTREYSHTAYNYFVEGTGLSAGSMLEALEILKNDEVSIVISEDGK